MGGGDNFGAVERITTQRRRQTGRESGEDIKVKPRLWICSWIALFLACCTTALAAPVVWTLNAVLTDAQTLTGSFSYDANLGQFSYPYSNISITNSGNTGVPARTWDTLFVFENGNPMGGPGFLYLMSGPANQTNEVLVLQYASNLTNAGGVVNLKTMYYGLISKCGDYATSTIELDCTSADALFGGGWLGEPLASLRIQSGTLAAVPVPAAAWLFGSSLAGLGALRRRKQTIG